MIRKNDDVRLRIDTYAAGENGPRIEFEPFHGSVRVAIVGRGIDSATFYLTPGEIQATAKWLQDRVDSDPIGGPDETDLLP